MQKNILCFFRAALGDFYLSFPLFYTLRNTYKKDKITLVASPFATPLLHDKGPWFDEIIHLEDFKPQKKYDSVFDIDFNRTGMSATFRPDMEIFDILEASYDVSYNRKKFQEIYSLNYTDKEKEEVDELLEKTKRVDARNIVIHTTHRNNYPHGKTPPQSWWEELISLYPQHNFYQVGTSQKLAERIFPDYDFTGFSSNVFNIRDRCNLKQTAYLLEQSDFYIAVDSVVAHLSLASQKRGLVLWGSSSMKIHSHDHNYNLSSKRPCAPCIDLSSNSNCCLYRDPSLYPIVDSVSRVLRENFLLQQPKKTGWLIEENMDKVPKNL